MQKSPLSLAFGGTLAMAAGIGIGRFVYTPILPPMAEALELSKSEAGLIASANFLGYLLGALLAARKLPGSRRGWLLGALAVNALGLAAMGATTSLPLFLLLRGLAGIASAITLVFASALVLDRLARAGRSQLSALHFAGVGTGIALSAVLVAGLLAQGAARSVLWYASGALSLLAIAAVAALVPPEDDAAPQAAVPTSAERRRPGFAALTVAYGLFGFGHIITATFIVAMVREAKELAPLEPYIWVLFGLSAAPSVALWTALARRWGILRSFAIAAIVEAAGVAASVFWLSPASTLLTSILVGGTFMGLTALGLIAARESGGGDPRGRIALVTASFSAGQILGPSFAGYVYDLTGSLALPSLAAAGALVVAGILAYTTGARASRLHQAS